MTTSYIVDRGPLRTQIAYRLRVIRVLVQTEFKLKYAGSTLGYLWSLGKPTLYIAVLWVVFGHLFRGGVPHFPVYLAVGVILFTFFADAVALSLTGIVERGTVLRRIAFPALTIPIATTSTAAVTFLFNCVAVGGFAAVLGIAPRPGWLWIVPLVLELYAFTLGISMIFSSLNVRFRDAAQVWEVLSTVILYSSAIMYPLEIMPHWAQRIVSCSPIVQVVQDARAHVLAGDPSTAPYTHIAGTHWLPLGAALAAVALGVLAFRREAPRFAEAA